MRYLCSIRASPDGWCSNAGRAKTKSCDAHVARLSRTGKNDYQPMELWINRPSTIDACIGTESSTVSMPKSRGWSAYEDEAELLLHELTHAHPRQLGGEVTRVEQSIANRSQEHRVRRAGKRHCLLVDATSAVDDELDDEAAFYAITLERIRVPGPRIVSLRPCDLLDDVGCVRAVLARMAERPHNGAAEELGGVDLAEITCISRAGGDIERRGGDVRYYRQRRVDR